MSDSVTVAGGVPDDLILVGYITGAYGLNGWVKIKPYSAEADALLHAKTWWLDKPALRDVAMMQVKMHSDDIVAQLMGVADRNAAEALKGATVQISRRHFPALSDDEFYWIDLIGLDVETTQGVPLGQVIDMMDNGAHPILRVVASVVDGDKVGQELLIPFVEQFVLTVDKVTRKITVDWEVDF